MRLKDLRWYILSCIIIVLSYAAIAYCYYLPVKAKTISSIEELTIQAVNNDIRIAENEIRSYYDQFVVRNFADLVTDFNKSSYKTKMKDKEYFISPGNYFDNNLSDDLYVFFCNHEETDESKIGAYIKLKDIISFSEFDVVVFNDTAAIKYDSLTNTTKGTMNRLLNDEDFLNTFTKEFELTFSKVYYIDGVEGVLSVAKLQDYYYSVFMPLESSFFSIDWVLDQAVSFYIIGVVLFVAMLVILILGCRKASVLLRVDRHAVNTSHSIIIRVRKDGKIIFTNTTFKKMFNMKKLPDMNDFLEVHSGKPIYHFLKNKATIECCYTFEDRTRYFQLTPIGVVSTYYVVGSDITEQFLRIRELEKLNGKNEYTGCDNNFTLANMYPSIIAQAETDIAFVEFHIFKYYDIISLFGEDSYYTLLGVLLEALREEFENTSIYHIRDDEFLILVANIDVKDVMAMIDRTMIRLRKPFLVKNNNIYVHSKVAVYNLPKEEMNDTSLTTVKKRLELAYNNISDFRDRDTILYVDAMEGVLTSNQQMEEDLKYAIANEEFEMYLQPQLDISTNRVVGFESLIRWNNPKYSQKSPQAFIDLAEQKGVILEISKFVIRETLNLAKQLEDYNITISLNLSPIQIMQVGFVNDLINQFNEKGLRKGSIALEITENVLMENFLLINEKLKLLKDAGFEIHLDDFGTGYSSMAYLTEFRIDTIKIDYGFTRYVDTNKVNYSIVSCICTLAKELGLNVICEGVETESQKEIVKKFGCKVIQGFYVSKAMSSKKALEFLEERNQKKGGK